MTPLIASGIATAIKSTSRYFWNRLRKPCRTSMPAHLSSIPTGQNRTSPICNWSRLNRPPTRSDSGVFSLENARYSPGERRDQLTSPRATSDDQRASLEWDENNWPPYCSVRPAKDGCEAAALKCLKAGAQNGMPMRGRNKVDYLK